MSLNDLIAIQAAEMARRDQAAAEVEAQAVARTGMNGGFDFGAWEQRNSEPEPITQEPQRVLRQAVDTVDGIAIPTPKTLADVRHGPANNGLNAAQAQADALAAGYREQIKRGFAGSGQQGRIRFSDGSNSDKTFMRGYRGSALDRLR